jgi:hypothetical protein
LAREKNTARSEARRRTRAAARELASSDPEETDDDLAPEAEAPAARPSLFKMPNIREDIRAVPEMLRTRRLLWVPFVLLLSSFVVALAMPFDGIDPSVSQFLFIFVQMAFLPQGLIVFLLAGFLAPRASYLVGFILGLINAGLLLLFAAIRSEAVLAAGTDQQAESQVGLALLIGYALVVGPLAAAFAAWYRSFLNRMGTQGRERRMAREAELAKRRREEKRSAKRPANSKTSA